MKKIKLSLVIALLGVVSIVGAQNSSFSIKGGLNMSNFYGDDLSDKSMRTGFHAGIGADFEFAPNMAIQSGLLFTSKGAKYTSDILDSELDVNANFIQLPLHFAYKIDVMPGTRIVLHAGPYIAYGVGGKAKVNIAGESRVESDTFDSDFGLKKFDSGLGLGVGAEFGRILLDIGWDMGLVDLSRAEGDYGEEIKTQNAYISLGYKF